MNKLVFFPLFLMLNLVFVQISNSQETVDTSSIPPLNTGYFTVGISGSLASYIGDYNVSQNISSLNSFRPSVGVHVEKRFGKILGISLNTDIGRLSQNDRNNFRNVNFETNFTQVGLSLIGNFDWKSTSAFSPFIAVGANYVRFSVNSDLKDAQGRDYHYWSDGTIRIVPQKDTLGNIIPYSSSPEVTQRDYTYESNVRETFDGLRKKDYPTTCFNFPVTVGVKFKLFEFFETRLSTTYNFLTSDYMDNFFNGFNDSYLSTSLSLHYTIGKRYVDPKEAPHKDVDFKSIAKQDLDGDGVADILDDCPHTPRNISVDIQGCPLDDDKDGVPNYLDKEPNSASGAIVNRDGITLTEDEIKKLYEIRESTYMEKITAFYELPSEETLRKIAEDLGKDIDVSAPANTNSKTTPENAQSNTTVNTNTKDENSVPKEFISDSSDNSGKEKNSKKEKDKKETSKNAKDKEKLKNTDKQNEASKTKDS